MKFCIERYLRIKSSPINAIWFIKTNFLEAILKNKKYFRLSIGEIVLFEVFTLAGSQNWKKKATRMPQEEHIHVWQRVWIMKLLHDYDPLKQTKMSDSLVLCQAYHKLSFGLLSTFQWQIPETNENVGKGNRLFSWLETSRRKFGFHTFKPFLNISFRLSRPFSIKRNWVRKMANAITERSQN